MPRAHLTLYFRPVAVPHFHLFHFVPWATASRTCRSVGVFSLCRDHHHSLGREGQRRSVTRTGTSCSAATRTRPVNHGPKRLAINGVWSNEHRPAGEHGAQLRTLQMLLGNARDAMLS